MDSVIGDIESHCIEEMDAQSEGDMGVLNMTAGSIVQCRAVHLLLPGREERAF